MPWVAEWETVIRNSDALSRGCYSFHAEVLALDGCRGK